MNYSIGFAKRDITPPVGIRLCGYRARTEASTGSYHALLATAMAVDDGRTGIIIVGADILGFYDRCDLIRSAVSAATGLPEENIILAGSHTHCGPHIRDFDVPRLGPVDMDYLGTLRDQIADAAREAWSRRSPASLTVGTGRCEFAVSRRRPNRTGTVDFAPYPEGISDHDVPVLIAHGQGGTISGCLFSYACHPTSRAGLLVGPDYVGFAKEMVEQRVPGAVACFAQGCGADQKPMPRNPADVRFDQREVSEVEELGERLGTAVVETVEDGRLKPVSGSIEICRRILILKAVSADMDEVRELAGGGDVAMREWAQGVLTAVAQRRELPREATFEIQTITFGTSLAVVTLAGEITVEHGLRLKRDLGARFDHVLPIGYANHVVGYVPVERQISEKGYCVEWANRFHGRSGRWVDGTEDYIHSTVAEMLMS